MNKFDFFDEVKCLVQTEVLKKGSICTITDIFNDKNGKKHYIVEFLTGKLTEEGGPEYDVEVLSEDEIEFIKHDELWQKRKM